MNKEGNGKVELLWYGHWVGCAYDGCSDRIVKHHILRSSYRHRIDGVEII